MNANQTRPMIVAIGANDDFIHAYEDDQALLNDHAIGAGEGERSGPLEFFDTAGHRLTGVYNQQWRLVCLRPTADAPDPALVRQRIQNVFDHLRSYIKSHPDQAEIIGVTVDEVLELIPDLGGPVDLDEALKNIFLVHNLIPTPDFAFHITGNPIHDFSHFGGFRS